MSRRVLMVSFHYPPVAGSSGYQRVLSFARGLPAHGWEPLVLTVQPRAYPAVEGGRPGAAAPPLPPAIRAWALDGARHLAIAGRRPACVAWPDRWSTWWLGATLGARGAIRRFDPDVVWSTYPIATAHWIGASLHRALRKPWVADFRDPMTEDNYPDPTAGRLVRRIERTAVARAARCVVTTPGAQRLYREWYPDSAPKWRCIPNGFDEEAFAAAEPLAALRSREPAGPIRLVHTGIVYPVERNPKPLFDALASLARRGWLAANPLRVVLRATGHDEQIRKLAVEAGAAEHVDLLPAVPYRENLAELLTSDGLLLMQGSICNDQIPAKVYEYIRARRPVLALTDPIGDTAAVLRSVGLDRIAPLDDAAAIERAIVDFVDDVRRGAPRVPTAEAARGFDRRLGTERLAALLDEVVGGR